jgi:hypothetical protein
LGLNFEKKQTRVAGADDAGKYKCSETGVGTINKYSEVMKEVREYPNRGTLINLTAFKKLSAAYAAKP